MLRHIKQRGVCNSGTHRVTATPKPLEFIASNNSHVENERNSSDIHGITEHISSELSDETRSINSQNGRPYQSSLDAQSPQRDNDTILPPTTLISPIPSLYDVNWVSPASIINSNSDVLSNYRYDEVRSHAQALSSHEVSIEGTIEIVSELMENSIIDDDVKSSGSLSHSESDEISEDEH